MNSRLLSLIAILPIFFLTSGVFAQGSEIKFTSVVSSVTQSSDLQGTIEVSLHGVLVPVMVNGDTEIEDSGEEISVTGVSAGDYVRIDAFFAEEGIVAEEVTIVDSRREQFRFRGSVQAVSATDSAAVLTIMGVDIIINDATDITRRGSGTGNDLLPSEIVEGDIVNISGELDGSNLVAERIHVGEREQGNVEIDGSITEVGDSSLNVDIGDGLLLLVLIDGDTAVRGTLAVDAYVEIEGRFNEELAILGYEIVVDEDEDRDADDDNSRGRRGDNPGRNDSDDDDDDDSDGDRDQIRTGREIQLKSDTTSVNGKVEYSYSENNSGTEQELEIEIEDAQQGDAFTILVLFGTDEVDFGSIEADQFGNADVEFKTDSDDPDESDLTELLPAGSDVRDITSVQILQGGAVILEAEF